MPEPALLKQSVLFALLTGVQLLMPAVVAVASLYATVMLFQAKFDPSSGATAIVAVLCLILIQPPREMNTHFASARVSTVVDVVIRWLLLLAVLLAVGYLTKSISIAYPRRVFITWALITPVALIVVTLAMQEIIRVFVIKAFDKRTAIMAGYNPS